MSKVVIQVNYLVKEDALDDFIGLLKKNSEYILNEPGCLNYEASRDGNNVFLYEKYENIEVFEFHKSTPQSSSFREATENLLLSKEVKIYKEI